MKSCLLFLFVTFEAKAGNVQLEGDISVRLNKDEVLDSNEKEPRADSADSLLEIVPKTKLITVENTVEKDSHFGLTVAPVVECLYQIPEEKQVRALLSNMMNELTKMFVRAHKYVNLPETRRGGAKRFNVVTKKQAEFFENIYNNMTNQYLSFYNKTAIRVDRSGRKDPCENQEEMKELWKDLLESSLIAFRQAALRCIDEHLKANGENKGSKVRERIGFYLLRKLSKIKMSQLELLCDKFQLCYNELMRRHNK